MMPALSEVAAVLGLPLLACVAMTLVLGYLGLHVLRRDIVFVDIAMAQIVAVGAIGAHLLFEAHDDSPLAYACAFGLALVAAAFYALTRRKVLDISTEAVIGVSYAIAAAAALFLLGVAPGGHVHAQHMLAGSILWATRSDLLVSGLAFLVVGICFCLLRRPFERISSDYEAAIRDGIRVVGWDFLFYALIGVVITFAVRMGGVVLVFCLLIIPATIAVMFSTRLVTRLIIAWSMGISGSLLGLLFADRLDFSVGPSVALLLGVALVVAGSWRRLPRVPAAVVTVAVGVVYVGLLVAVPAQETDPGVVGSEGAGSTRNNPGAGEPEWMPPAQADWQARCDAVLETVDRDFPSGALAALEFLGENPPIYYRQTVVDRLNAGLDTPLDFDVMRPFNDPANRRAVEALREARAPRVVK